MSAENPSKRTHVMLQPELKEKIEKAKQKSGETTLIGQLDKMAQFYLYALNHVQENGSVVFLDKNGKQSAFLLVFASF